MTIDALQLIPSQTYKDMNEPENYLTTAKMYKHITYTLNNTPQISVEERLCIPSQRLLFAIKDCSTRVFTRVDINENEDEKNFYLSDEFEFFTTSEIQEKSISLHYEIKIPLIQVTKIESLMANGITPDVQATINANLQTLFTKSKI